MSRFKVVPVETIMRAMDALELYASNTLAGTHSADELRMVLLDAPAVQGEPVAYAVFASNGNIRWCADPIQVETLRQEYGEALQPLYTAPQPTEQPPALAKYQPCGCVICTCEHETQCQGCGARHCGTHPVGQFLGPAYLQPSPDIPHGFNHCAYNRKTGEWLYINHANTWQLFQGPSHDVEPDVSALVEALEWLRGAINATPEIDKSQAGTWISTKHPRIKQIDTILAAHRKQEKSK